MIYKWIWTTNPLTTALNNNKHDEALYIYLWKKRKKKAGRWWDEWLSLIKICCAFISVFVLCTVEYHASIFRRVLRDVLLNLWAKPLITRTITSRRCRECTIKSTSFSESTTILSRCWSLLKSSTCCII